MKIDVTFLTWNLPEMSLQCLKAVKKHTRIPYRLIWVDNGSVRESFNTVKEYVETFEDYMILRLDRNRYYAESTNRGIKLSSAKYVVTLSNDVFVTEGWLTKLVKILERRPEIGLISPIADVIGSNCPRASLAVPLHRLLKLGEPYERINNLPSRFAYCEGNVSMFCAVLRRQMIEEVGLLDERFTCYGNDDDYNDRVKLVGWKTAVALNCFVRHIHNATKTKVFTDIGKKTILRRAHKELLAVKRRERAEAK